ncbi:carboxymuconolactone decarboxylase family protein [Streptomyces sp. NPDC001276]|uniref:carboxymuconolactone decarboxylase family protein n=1 Tax=unclassified Streptomyces TaxID=2593676 RepID=UPI0036C43492
MSDDTVDQALTRLPRSGPVRAPNHRVFARRTSQDTDGDVSRVLGKLEATGQNYTVLQVLANASVLFRPFVLLSDALNNHSVIPPNVREAVILLMAARGEVQYEWAEHVPMAREAGLTDSQIAALAEGSSPPSHLFSAAQLGALALTEELSRGAGVAADTWQRVSAEWGEAGALELIAIVGWWGGFVQTMLDALGLIYPDDGRPGRRPRS